MSFKIEKIRRYLAGQKPKPGRPHHVFEHNSKGFLVTGYADGSDWLVSPLGRDVYGKVIRDRPDTGWAIARDRRNYHRLHLYILDFPSKSFREVAGLSLTGDLDIVDYDGERLIFLLPPLAEPKSLARELAIVDIASAQVVDRFALKGLTHLFCGAIGRTPDGWIVMAASRLGENNERLYIHGIARVHPLTRDLVFEMPFEGFETFTISPSGRYLLKACDAVLPVTRSVSDLPTTAETSETGTLYERKIEVWAGSPFSQIGDCPLEWASTGDRWKVPWNVNYSTRVIWEPGEAAFWWVAPRQVTCVGMDGRTSPSIRLNSYAASFTALPGRAAELTVERETNVELYRVDGSPSEDLSPVDAPAPTILTPSAADVERQRRAQAALKKIVSQKSDLRFTVKTSSEEDVLATVDAITLALDRGLGWYADDDGIIKLAVKIAGTAYNEKRFFALVEKLGIAAAPALRRLLAKCRADADFPQVWSGELEEGQQAFGAAAKALGGMDPSAWIELAEYEMCLDDSHELYFRGEVIPHFLKSHGWCEESFALALADIVQVRGNLGDDFTYSWRRSGLAAAAEAKYTPAAFAALMLGIRDRMHCSVTGSFAAFVARADAAPPPAYGWHNYDRLFEQLEGSLTSWEERVFAELRRKS